MTQMGHFLTEKRTKKGTCFAYVRWLEQMDWFVTHDVNFYNYYGILIATDSSGVWQLGRKCGNRE